MNGRIARIGRVKAKIAYNMYMDRWHRSRPRWWQWWRKRAWERARPDRKTVYRAVTKEYKRYFKG